MFYPYSALGPVIQGAKVRVLASTGEKRSALTPSTPTMIEAGLPELTLSGYSIDDILVQVIDYFRKK